MHFLAQARHLALIGAVPVRFRLTGAAICGVEGNS